MGMGGIRSDLACGVFSGGKGTPASASLRFEFLPQNVKGHAQTAPPGPVALRALQQPYLAAGGESQFRNIPGVWIIYGSNGNVCLSWTKAPE